MSTSSALTGYMTAHNSQQQQQQQPTSNDNEDVQKTHKTKCLPCEGLDPSARLSYEQVVERITTLPMWTVISASTVTTTPRAAATAAPSSLEGTAAAVDRGGDDGTNHPEQPIWMISRKFTARNFQAAMNAVNAMGTIAEREQHHPDFHLTSYRHVQIDIYTHSVQGLTENDFILAHLLDAEVTIDYSPKWLNEQPWGASSKKTTS